MPGAIEPKVWLPSDDGEYRMRSSFLGQLRLGGRNRGRSPLGKRLASNCQKWTPCEVAVGGLPYGLATVESFEQQGCSDAFCH
jgi:hypothetical protein